MPRWGHFGGKKLQIQKQKLERGLKDLGHVDVLSQNWAGIWAALLFALGPFPFSVYSKAACLQLSLRSPNQKQKRLRTHIALISMVTPIPPTESSRQRSTWSISCYELTRGESWLQRQRAKPNTSLLQLIVPNCIHIGVTHIYVHSQIRLN